MSNQLKLPLNHNRASKSVIQPIQYDNSTWISEAVERYERKKRKSSSKQGAR